MLKSRHRLQGCRLLTNLLLALGLMAIAAKDAVKAASLPEAAICGTGIATDGSLAQALAKLSGAKTCKALQSYLQQTTAIILEDFFGSVDLSLFVTFPHLVTLEFPQAKFVDNLSALDALPNLVSLAVPCAGQTNKGNDVVDDAWMAVGKWHQLRRLQINCEISSWEFLKPLVNLTHLDIDAPITSLAELGLSQPQNLQALTFWDYRGTDLDWLLQTPALRSLKLDASRVTDIAGLRHTPHLRQLFLYRLEAIDPDPLADLTKLEDLSLRWSQFGSWRFLRDQNNLTKLSLHGTNFTKTRYLASMTKLVDLDLGRIELGIADLRPLTKLFSLRRLQTIKTELGDLVPLAKLPIEVFRGNLRFVAPNECPSDGHPRNSLVARCRIYRNLMARGALTIAADPEILGAVRQWLYQELSDSSSQGVGAAAHISQVADCMMELIGKVTFANLAPYYDGVITEEVLKEATRQQFGKVRSSLHAKSCRNKIVSRRTQ